MSLQDPISDMLTRIRNAQHVGEEFIKFQASTLKLAILNVLKKEGFIEDYSSVKENNKHDISVKLKYYQGRPVIEKIQRVSRPSIRVYAASRDLPHVLGGMGIAIVSTPKGVMTAKQAKAEKLGGEVLCIVE